MTAGLSERARQVLSRFPAHLDVERPGKQITNVVEGLAADFDAFSSQAAGVRNAHRLGFAPTIRDLMQLGALHGLGDADLSITTIRTERLQQLIDALQQGIAGGVDAARAAATALLDAFGIAGGDERLAALAPGGRDGTPPDELLAAQALLHSARDHIGFDAVLEGTRRRLTDICVLHAAGNGTVRALLLSALSALDLEVDVARNDDVRARRIAERRTEGLDFTLRDEFFHSADHFWHSTYIAESRPLVVEIGVTLPPAPVLMGGTIALAVLAQRSGVAVARLIARAQAAGHADATFSTRVTFDEADAIAVAEGFAVQRVQRGTMELTGGLIAADVGVRLGIAGERVVSDLLALSGAAVPAATLLTPQQVAVVARKFGYRVMLRPAHRMEVLGIEENPLRRETRDPVDCTHGQTFTVRRRGFGREPLRITVEGIDDLTMSPMVVNRDEGRGVGFQGSIPGGSRLMVTEEGRVFLDGDDSTSAAYSWTGACFADAIPHARDFVFAGPGVPVRRQATFINTVPLNALDRGSIFPHGAESLTVPGINVGETRFAFFVQHAHVGARARGVAPLGDVTATPVTMIGFANQSVFAGGDEVRSPVGTNPLDPVAGKVTLSWMEHEAYGVRVLIPSRFRMLSGDDVSIETRLERALERIRPAGVDVRVEFADDRWTLGAGVLTDEDPLDDNPNDLLRGGTLLWPPDTDT